MKVYLAGPDVFFPHAAAHAAAKKRICAAHGLEGVFPTDPIENPAADAADAHWYAIYLRNEAHIRRCDALIANLTPFRGPSADVGTVYELGFMRALGRPIAGYSNAAPDFLTRSRAATGATRDAAGHWRDAEGLGLEAFGLVDNLMVDGGIRAAGGLLAARDVPPAERWHDLEAFTLCVRAIAARLLANRTGSAHG